MFAKAESKVSQTQSVVTTEKVEKKEPVKLLQPERYRNVEIILTKLKVPEGEMK